MNTEFNIGNNCSMKKIVIACIGTTKIIGDSVGPIVGELLKLRNVQACVYGSICQQINAININNYGQKIKNYHPDSLVIAVDSALGNISSIGKIKIVDGGIKPGGAFSDEHDKIGDIGILAVVGQSQGDRLLELKSRSFSFIFEMAIKIVECIDNVIQQISQVQD